MKTTINIDDALLAEAARLTRITVPIRVDS
jgi:Arc/MetJ family transcription regulator